jgi:hypothetical protein
MARQSLEPRLVRVSLFAATWPKSMDQIPFDFDHVETTGPEAPLFPFAYGLDTEGLIRTAPVQNMESCSCH